MACVIVHNAIWKHRNEVTFQNKACNPTVIKSIFKSKMIKLIQVKKYQIEEFYFNHEWNSIEDKLLNHN